MSRFYTLRKHLGLSAAIAMYRKLKSGRPVDIKVNRLLHPFSMRNNPYDFATFEEVILNETYSIALDFTPASIIDGGGNIGLTACYFATKYPGAKVVTIEPDTDNFNILQSNIKPYASIEAIKAGVWNRDTHLKISNADAGNNAFTVEETDQSEEGTIAAVSISSVMQRMGWNTIDVLKLDIEGAEKEVFSGDVDNWLPKTKVLIIELHDMVKPGCSKAVFRAINPYNFSFNIKGENIIFTNLDF